jgi:hypothetical protein
MARKGASAQAEGTAAGATVTSAAYWHEQIAKQTKEYSLFQAGGDRVIDRYRIEKANAQAASLQDRYNILYSSTETMRPSLYAQSPKVQVTKRHRDRKQPTVQQAVDLLESTVEYAVEEMDFDEVMENVVEDYLLPGLGVAWVRYEPVFKDQTDDTGGAVNDNNTGEPAQVLASESIGLDYISWKDVLFGPCRTFKELPWAAKRVYMSKAKVTARFSQAIADKIQYRDSSPNKDRGPAIEDKQAIIWEIWDKEGGQVIWIADGLNEVLDTKKDPLRLKKFWPFPKPMRAISNTRTFVPRPFYSQYQSQAEELDNITHRIRNLTNALNVRGVFDGSVSELQSLLSPTGGNKMIPVPNWHQFIGQSGVNGSIEWVPIDKIVQVLMELYKARDAAKAEIYEITGFSDIVRGLSKASETLGAQKIKQDWAGGRLRIMQKEVQRFCRDIIRIVAEIAAEHFTEETFALYSGFELPPAPPPPPMPQVGQPPMPPQPDPRQVAVQQFKAALGLLKAERERCANIDIETDSTILPDEENERKDRLEFLGQIGAFMQQAAPTVQQFPQMAGLLGAMMMFTVRTFRASRPIEQEFEHFQDLLAKTPPQPNAGKDGDGAARAQATVHVATLKVQGDAAKHDKELAFKAAEGDKDRQLEQARIMLEQKKLEAQAASEQVQLEIKRVELSIKQAELAIKQNAAVLDVQESQHERSLATEDQAHKHAMERQSASQDAYEFDVAGQRQDEQFAADGERQDRQLEADRENPQENEGGA